MAADQAVNSRLMVRSDAPLPFPIAEIDVALLLALLALHPLFIGNREIISRIRNDFPFVSG